MKKNQKRQWTEAEDRRLLEQVNKFPQNLSKCFLIVSEVLNRTPGAVANRWYNKLSKDSQNLCLYTNSPECMYNQEKKYNKSIWDRFLSIFKRFLQ